MVLRPVETRGSQPVLQRQFLTVADTEPALFGTVDEEEPAERPECLPTEVGRVLLVEDQHAVAPFDQFARCDQPGETRPHDNDIGVRHETQH
ncbi:hypothetical protein BN970_06161 [Mycolicibacterium conceptionense]|uniref:Uncharacterized protein n=1 Tax=Mycolicibacterium conceptionense TaxID=451644 RepID=A0A0U1DWJ7_9MYCO|nr:hypothetical protein BN970_06161 [Mycolicibacterium conceptionense]